jgi:hypothetical protein
MTYMQTYYGVILEILMYTHYGRQLQNGLQTFPALGISEDNLHQTLVKTGRKSLSKITARGSGRVKTYNRGIAISSPEIKSGGDFRCRWVLLRKYWRTLEGSWSTQ